MRQPVYALLLAAALGCACSGGGRGDATTTTAGRVAPPTTPAFELSSPAFAEGEPIPNQYSVDGGNLSPPLTWTSPPEGTKSLAITVVDPDAGNFVHWAVAGIDPSVTAVEEGELPPGVVEALNQFGQPGWGGPAPPPGEPHTYLFTLHALSRDPGISPSTAAAEAVATIEDVTIARAELRGMYETRR